MRDTSPGAEKRYFELLAAAGPQKRLELAVRLSAAVRQVAVAGIRATHPSYTDAQVRAELAARLYGSEVARQVFGSGERGV